MSIRRVVVLTLAAAWCAVALAVIGITPVVDSVRSLGRTGPVPSAGEVAGVVAWLAAAVFIALAVADTSWWLIRRGRVRLRVPVVVCAVGALLLAAGIAAHVSSYRVCCAPPPAAVSR